MAEPFTVRQDSPMAVGSGICDVATLVGFRFVPNTAISEPGARVGVRSAALTTPWIAGGATGVSKFHDSAVKPDTVSAIKVLRLAKGARVRVNTELPLAASGC